MAAEPATGATVAYRIGADTLTPSARLITKPMERPAVEEGLITLLGQELDAANCRVQHA